MFQAIDKHKYLWYKIINRIIFDIENTVLKVVNLVDEKGIRFESWTTAITVFDERKCVSIGETWEGAFLAFYRFVISQDTCRIFMGLTRFGREECNRFIRAYCFAVHFFARFLCFAINPLCSPELKIGGAFIFSYLNN